MVHEIYAWLLILHAIDVFQASLVTWEWEANVLMAFLWRHVGLWPVMIIKAFSVLALYLIDHYVITPLDEPLISEAWRFGVIVSSILLNLIIVMNGILL